MIAVERIVQGRQAGLFACKSRQHDAATALFQQRGERFTGMARRAASFEYHLVAIWLKTFDPADEGGSTVEKSRLVDHATGRPILRE
jgi:hypothetical protein